MVYWRLFYHFVWATKGREANILPFFERNLYRAIYKKAGDFGAIVHAVGGCDDHIHLAVSIPPKISISQFIGAVKGSSSHFVNNEIKLDIHFLWQTQYSVHSFGESELPTIVRYIHQQKEHHNAGTINNQYEHII